MAIRSVTLLRNPETDPDFLAHWREVNRHLKRSTVGLDDIRRALAHEQLIVLPGDYKSVLPSIDSGMPLLEYDPTSPVSKGILELQREICGGPHVEHHGLLHRALPIFSGG